VEAGRHREKKFIFFWVRSRRSGKNDYLCSPVREKREKFLGLETGVRPAGRMLHTGGSLTRWHQEEREVKFFRNTGRRTQDGQGSGKQNSLVSKFFVTAKSLILAQDER
jgi:hypothetical protein